MGLFGIAAGDFNEDGNLDLATTTSLGINTFPGNGDGTYGTQVLFPAPEGTHDLLAHDLNGDGHIDLVGQGAHSYPSSTPGAHLTVILGNGDGTFQTRQIYAGDPSGSTGMDIGDVDQDGDPDVLLSNYYSHDVSVHLNRGDGTFEEPHRRYGAAGNLIDIRVRDFTGDGVLDFSVGTRFDLNSVGVQVIPGTGGVIPVELTSFTASTSEGEVTLNWSTATETNSSGFEIEKRQDSEWERIGFVEGHGTTTERQKYSYIDRNVTTGKYLYRLKQIDFDGSYEYSKVVDVDINSPIDFALQQNFPNPYNPSTIIKYSLPIKTQIQLIVFNALGEELRQLVNEEKEAGNYEIEFNASSLPSGVYFYQLIAGNFVETKKMILIK